MKINRNNYEEYFMLYADNELDAATKLDVEKFIHQNADLSVELDMLLQTKSAPEEIVFTDKENLIRTEGNSINESNHEEYFLLYIDNELSAAKRAEVEMYVLQHPKLQDEFTTLKQAVLTPNLISYSDKKDLYRTEKRRTVYLRPWRFAAAAVLVGVCATGVWLMQKHSSAINVADNNSSLQKSVQKPLIAKPADTVNHQPQQTEQIIAQQPVLSKQNKADEEKATAIKKRSVNNIKQTDVAKHETLIQEKNEPIKIIEQDNVIGQKDLPVADDKNDVAVEAIPSNKKEIITAQQQQDKGNEISNGYKLYNVAYKEINTNDDDNSLHVGAFDLNKSKVKNLFKKAKRLFKKDGDTDDGKLQVANFEIPTNEQ